jgi:hypothetical protein
VPDFAPDACCIAVAVRRDPFSERLIDFVVATVPSLARRHP